MIDGAGGGRRGRRACSPTTRRRPGTWRGSCGTRAAAAAEAARSGRAPRGRRLLRARAAPRRATTRAGARDAARGPVRWSSTSPTGSTTRSPPAGAGAGAAPRARRRRRGRRGLTAPSPSSRWYAADRAVGRAAGRAPPSRSSTAPATHASWATPWPTAPSSRRSGATRRRRCSPAPRAQRIADEMGDEALHGTAAIGIAVARLRGGGRERGRADLLAARSVGPAAPARRTRHRTDEPPRPPRRRAGALRRSRGVARRRAADQRGARHPDLQHVAARGAGAAAAAAGPLARGRAGRPGGARGPGIPLGQLWPHLVLGLLAARRDAPPENPHLDELWRIAGKLDVPGHARRRPPPRSRSRRGSPGAPIPGSTARTSPALVEPGRPPAGARPARCGGGRAGSPTRGAASSAPGRRRPSAPGPEPYERALALWDDGTTDDLLAALPLLDELDARAVAAGVPRPGCASSACAACRAGRRR